MQQSELNQVRIDEWYLENLYEEKFRLKLTAKHGLVVGKWNNDNKWGVDLRRWSYDQSRLLAQGITLNSKTWQMLVDLLIDFYNKGYFTEYGDIDEENYKNTIKIDDTFDLQTTTFNATYNNRLFFCVNLLADGQQVRKGKYSPIGIMIRFDSISDFISECQRNKIVDLSSQMVQVESKVDEKTGKKIF